MPAKERNIAMMGYRSVGRYLWMDLKNKQRSSTSVVTICRKLWWLMALFFNYHSCSSLTPSVCVCEDCIGQVFIAKFKFAFTQLLVGNFIARFSSLLYWGSVPSLCYQQLRWAKIGCGAEIASDKAIHLALRGQFSANCVPVPGSSFV